MAPQVSPDTPHPLVDGKVAAVADPETPPRGRHPQRSGRVTARHDARLSDQRVRQQVRIAIRLQALDRMVVVLGGGLWIARVEGDAEIQAGVALSPQIAGGGLDRQRLVEQLSRASGLPVIRKVRPSVAIARPSPARLPARRCRVPAASRSARAGSTAMLRVCVRPWNTVAKPSSSSSPSSSGQFPRLAVESE